MLESFRYNDGCIIARSQEAKALGLKMGEPYFKVLYDPEQLDEVEVLEAVLDERLAAAEVDSPLRTSLEAQKRSVENYHHVIRQT